MPNSTQSPQTQRSQKNIVNIHGKDYMTVAGRLELAHDSMKNISINTEVLPIADQVVIKATITTPKGTFTGISAANPAKLIEKQSPYEVAETSAVGRALGFAGIGAIESIASADEITKSGNTSSGSFPRQSDFEEGSRSKSYNHHPDQTDDGAVCTCGTTGKYHAKGCPART